MVEGTDAKQVCAWSCFQLYLQSIGLQSDPYLDPFSQDQKIKILGACAQSIREGGFCAQECHTPLKSDSV